MATMTSYAPGLESQGASAPRRDTPGLRGMQHHDVIGQRMPTSALIVLRTAFILAQLLILLVLWQVLHWRFPSGHCLALISASAAMNLFLAMWASRHRKATSWEVNGQLSFDVIQVATLLYFTGGVVNPFALLVIAPVVVGGAALPPRHVLGLAAVALMATVALSIAPLPLTALPQSLGASFAQYRPGCTLALLVVTTLTGGFASWSSAEGARRELALHVAETVLAREQRMSALGALAAAVAHELGTPLATITVVAAELAREAPEGSVRDDARLLVEQTTRCRDILKRLAEAPEQQDAMHERMSLLQFVSEIVEPYTKSPEVRVEALVTGPPGVGAPDLWRRPEILHAITAFVENAYDFALSEILLTARFDAKTVSVEVRDDGPGFSPLVKEKLGEAYVTSRPGAEGYRTGHVGMGLGMFIAKTLLERSGAQVNFANGAKRGAIVTAKWPRGRIEAPEPRI
jgi:two-component system sensor histidine kinase RegB